MEHLANIDPLIALGVFAATALTDAVCVLYTASVAHRRDLAAANWGSLTYMLSAFAVISFINNWVYVVFAALGAWIGAYATMKYLRWRSPRAETSAAVVAAHDAQTLPAQTLPAHSFPAGSAERLAA
jgi:phage-related minor tail protein